MAIAECDQEPWYTCFECEHGASVALAVLTRLLFATETVQAIWSSGRDGEIVGSQFGPKWWALAVTQGITAFRTQFRLNLEGQKEHRHWRYFGSLRSEKQEAANALSARAAASNLLKSAVACVATTH